jgi:predicted RNA binding protein YcfA (HicA-like mRNA interferase family)
MVPRGTVLAHWQDRLVGQLPTLDQKKAKMLLEEHGWQQAKSGKHQIKMDKPGHRPITLPQHKNRTYGKALTASILREAGIEW